VKVSLYIHRLLHSVSVMFWARSKVHFGFTMWVNQ